MRVPVTPNEAVKARRNRRAIDEVRRRGPEGWVYLGTYPTDSLTTFDSPPFLNGYDSVVGKRVRFRWDEHYRLEWAGRLDVTGATTATQVCQLPDLWIPDEGYSLIVDMELDADPDTFNALRLKVEGHDDLEPGKVTAYWPVTA